MAKLERKTQEAVHTLIRTSVLSLQCPSYAQTRLGQRLAAQKGDAEDIVGAMNAQEKAEEEIGRAHV